ncbi:MAG: DUF1996 domain-containing protein [Steroidobacteraceae bacterium]
MIRQSSKSGWVPIAMVAPTACALLLGAASCERMTAAAAPGAPLAARWTRAADEDSTFTLQSPAKVRYGAGDRWAARDFAVGEVDCSNAVFGDPAPGVAKTCEVVPTSAVAEASPATQSPAALGLAPVPAPPNRNRDQIYTSLRVRASQMRPSSPGDGTGSFRNPCNYSHMGFDDPILFAGKPGASHLHVFFGNTSTDAYTTTESLFKAKSSTCAGGVANLSAYWIPALVDMSTQAAMIPNSFLFYYKSGYNKIPLSKIRPLPEGLRMIAGNRTTQASEIRSWTGSPNLGDVHHRFACNGGQKQQSIPAGCNGELSIELEFPNCWDGVNLGSADGRAHMRYSGGDVCPGSHPVPLPVISLNVGYAVNATQVLRLSSDNYSLKRPGGYSMHGDLWVRWTEGIAETWTDKCVRAPMDCHAYLTGDGRELY